MARAANGPCAGTSGPCRFDTRSLGFLVDGTFVESITASGRYFNFDITGNAVGSGDLRSVGRYASGPCALAPSGQPCTFDSRTFTNYPGAGWVESITAYGHGWNFDANGNPWAGNGFNLEAIERVAAKNTVSQYVRLAYRTLLNRDPALLEHTSFIDAIKSGTQSFSQVRDALLNSAEYGQRVSPETFITNAYQRYFSLTPPSEDLAVWAERVRNGSWTRSGVQAFFLNHAASQSRTPNAALVQAAYRLFLQREVDSDWWLNYLNSGGVTRADMRDAFLNCVEIRSKNLRALTVTQLQSLFDFSGS
ncbi:MAG: DUF4214 domain-containing protein [Pleurocapsa sp. SU_196_0]|nr:DUF4214 domain-containing protein [Pleurocapsa sp. SU_196_0]